MTIPNEESGGVDYGVGVGAVTPEVHRGRSRESSGNGTGTGSEDDDVPCLLTCNGKSKFHDEICPHFVKPTTAAPMHYNAKSRFLKLYYNKMLNNLC